ncbi:uncharacterized protein LOC117645506 [Thrips palmi]|uniref:Uncharacterized protein LOC117645506 n=1 Tax=Thrips palmi TaxID=161013 RepID=A0A6P8Z4X3_THRPL|nr:uncharacterized protein LOC117645506 [Thrips palmi]
MALQTKATPTVLLLLVVSAAIVLAKAVPVDVDQSADSAVLSRPASLLFGHNSEVRDAGAGHAAANVLQPLLLTCESAACTRKCRSQWRRGGSCERGLCICR